MAAPLTSADVYRDGEFWGFGELMEMASGYPTVLIVDDEPLILEMTSRLLRDSGYTVHTCHMWPTVANVVREHDPDLILLDYNMPGLRGDDLCVILKRNIGQRAKVILFSSEPEGDLVQITASCGADGYIKKNTSPTEVLERISSLV